MCSEYLDLEVELIKKKTVFQKLSTWHLLIKIGFRLKHVTGMSLGLWSPVEPICNLGPSNWEKNCAIWQDWDSRKRLVASNWQEPT